MTVLDAHSDQPSRHPQRNPGTGGAATADPTCCSVFPPPDCISRHLARASSTSINVIGPRVRRFDDPPRLSRKTNARYPEGRTRTPRLVIRVSQTVHSDFSRRSRATLRSLRRNLRAMVHPSPPRTATNASAASWTAASARCVYFRVVAGSLWPNSLPIVRIVSPWARATDAYL